MEFLSSARMFPLADGKLYGALIPDDPARSQFYAYHTDIVDGVQIRGVIRLNSDGSVDPGLNDPFGEKPDGVRLSTLRAATALADGRLCVAWGGIHRLLPDGKLDSAFHAQTGGRYVLDLVPQNEDRLIVVTAAWNPPSGNQPFPLDHSLGRRNPDGSPDWTFDARALERGTSYEHVLLTAYNLQPGNYYKIETSADLFHWNQVDEIRDDADLSDPRGYPIRLDHWDKPSQVFYRLTKWP